MNKRKFEYKSNNEKKIKTDNVNLTEEQKKVVDIVLKGESIFYTGSAGVGKSYLLRYLIKELKLKYREKYNVAVTASTSIAALNINGVLIIDEISMLSCDAFELINEILQEIRRNQNPFGGVQLIVTGDFFQLPPIPNKGDKRKPYDLHLKNDHEVIENNDIKYEPMILFSDKNSAKFHNYNKLHSLKGKRILEFYSNDW
ncbi:17321_t:CDS:2, partial [Dentiscutata heterogama]